MKQGKPLQRKTPLRAKKPMNPGSSSLKRTTPLKRDKSLQNKPGNTLQRKAPLNRTSPSAATVGESSAGKQKKPRKTLQNKPPKVTAEEQRTRKLVENRSDSFCEKCGTPGATDKAHRISRGVGGTWEPSNILDLCRYCHSYHHQNPAVAYEHGWHLRSHATPTKSPVMFHHDGTFGMAYLKNDGTFTWAKDLT